MMKSFSAFRHVGGDEIRFVGDCWADGGLHCDDGENPSHDFNGNTIARFSITELDPRDADLLHEFYCGDDHIDNATEYREWLVNAAGCHESVADEIISREVADMAN